MTKLRLGVLISGRGTNLQSLIDACKTPDFPAEIACVISNKPDAAGLDRARSAGIDAISIPHKNYPNRKAFEADLTTALTDQGVGLVCNAGFMRLLTDGFVDHWYNRQINIHPSLLPAFKGLHVHEQVLEAGARISGCTVHYVRTEMDAGPIIAQAAVPVLPDDTPDTLADRVLGAEHALYPKVVRGIANGTITISGEDVSFGPTPDLELGPMISPVG